MDTYKAKKLVEELLPMQEKGAEFPCPRCGRNNMHTDRPVLNTLSRHAKVYVCEECGIDEALRDMSGSPLPINQWAMPRGFDKEDKPKTLFEQIKAMDISELAEFLETVVNNCFDKGRGFGDCDECPLLTVCDAASFEEGLKEAVEA